MERQRERARAAVRPYDPVAARRWRAKHRLSRYGMTRNQFDELLKAQGYACGMCHELFGDEQPVFIDHDHAHCPDEKSSCGVCVRGLLCLSCNTALGHIERKIALARAYLADGWTVQDLNL
jgi:hypothetical protein